MLQSKNRSTKKQKRIEKEFYTSESTKKWVEALRPLHTGPSRPFLKTAPYLIVIFAELYGLLPNGEKKKYYYVKESIGIATGMLISAIHYAGHVSLTYTPYKMDFLSKILSRPTNEKPFMILVTGYPADEAMVPNITKESYEEIMTFI